MKWAAVCSLISMYLIVGALVTRVICESTKEVLQLVAMVSVPPDSNHHRSTQDWERGLEILPGAHVAVQEVNRNTDVLPGYQLELVELITEGCSDNLALVQLVQHLVSQAESEGERESQTVGIIGPLCNDAAELIATVAAHPEHGLVQISAADSVLSRSPYQFQMLPLTRGYITTAIKGLMFGLGWSRISVLCSTERDQYDCASAEAFAKEAQAHGIEVVFFAEIGLASLPFVLTNLQESGAKIIVAFLQSHIASELLHAAYGKGITWPEYGWLLPGLGAESFEVCTACNHSEMRLAIEGVLFLEFDSFKGGFQYSNTSDTNRTQVDFTNLYAFVFYDSVWAFALALNGSNLQFNSVFPHRGRETAENIASALLNISFRGSTGLIEFDSDHNRKYVRINIKQVQEGASILVGHYDPMSDTAFFNTALFGEIPNDELETVYSILSFPIALVFSTLKVLGFAFTTVLFLCYMFYRNEPEIKATSTSLTVLLFIGCYLVLLGSLSITITASLIIHGLVVRIAACQVFSCSMIVGFDLFLATLFVRMLRVYRVFSYFGRTGKLYSNRNLFLLIMCIVGGKVLILALWGFLDTYRYVDWTVYRGEGRPPYYEVEQHCGGMYHEVWFVICAIYTAVLCIAVFVVAFKTRKISNSNFKDTKKVIVLLLSLVLLWTIFPILIVITNDSNVIFLYGEVPILFTVFGNQSFFFVPKVFAPLSRSFKHCMHKYMRPLQLCLA